MPGYNTTLVAGALSVCACALVIGPLPTVGLLIGLALWVD